MSFLNNLRQQHDYEINGPQVQRAPEVRPRQKQPVLDSVLNKYGRPAAGKEFIVEFQCHANDSVRFFCTLCNKDTKLHAIDAHCANLLHLFRYIKSTMPCEYNRIIANENLNNRIKHVLNLIKMLQQRVFKRFRPQFVLLQNTEDQFFTYIHQNFKPREIEIENSAFIADINDLQENEYNFKHPQSSSILDALKEEDTSTSTSGNASTFFSHVLAQNQLEDIEMVEPVPRNRAAIQPNREENSANRRESREVIIAPDDETIKTHTLQKIKSLAESAKSNKEIKVIKEFYKLVQKNSESQNSEATTSSDTRERDRDRDRDRERDHKRKISESSSVSSELNQGVKREQSLKHSPKRARVENERDNSHQHIVKMEPITMETAEVNNNNTQIVDEQAQRDKEFIKLIKRFLRGDQQDQINFEFIQYLNEFILRNSDRIEHRLIMNIHDKVELYL